jgi:Protein of unknown function (DUF5672)
MKQQVCITVPIYKTQPNASEIVSLRQLNKILGKYPIAFYCANDFDAKAYSEMIPQAKIIRFETHYFNSINGYSKLMLSHTFYQKFIDFHYILIYQLDAYVFSDHIDFWCNKNYDYIGAPWLVEPILANGKPKINLQKWFVNKVGNGGFSLRKVKSHYRNALFFKPILSFFSKNEDMFWGLFLYWLNPFFKRPKATEALNFAFEMEPKMCFETNHNVLPFGVHAWKKYDPQFWKEYIQS